MASLPREDVTHVVVEGIVRLVRCSSDGRALAQADLAQGSVFDCGMLLGVRSDAIVGIAATEATICLLPWPVFLRAVIGTPASAAVVIGQLRRERRYFADLAGDALLHDRATRVRHVVRRLALESEEHVVTLTGEEIACMAGTSKEAVSRVLADLKRRGMIQGHHRRQLFTPDPDELL